MAVRVSASVDIKRSIRQLQSVRVKGVFAAQKAIMTKGSDLMLASLLRQWRSDMVVRKRSFPKQVLRRRRANVDFKTGRIRRVGRVLSIGADDLLRLQIKGGTRRPRGRALFVRENTRRRAPRDGTFRAGPYVFRKLKRKDKYLGVLADFAIIKRRWRIGHAVRRVERVMPRVALREVQRELRSALNRP